MGPSVADVSFSAGGTVTNEVTTSMAGGDVSVTLPAGGGSADVVVDVVGYLASANLTGSGSYGYDGAGRLTSATLPAASYSYGYGTTSGCPQNAAGMDTNRTSLTVTGNGVGTTSYCYDNSDRLTSTSSIPQGQVLYDAHGNMTQEGSETFAYDSSDQLTTGDGPAYLTFYQRDPLGRPAQLTTYTKITPGASTTASTTTTLSPYTITLNRPGGTIAGDVLLAAVTWNCTTNSITPPTGWNVVTSVSSTGGLGGTDSMTSVLYHVASSSDPGSWAFNVNCVAANAVGSMMDYHNSGTSPIDVSIAQADPSSTSQPLPQVTTTGDAETIVHVVGYNANVTPSNPGGDSQRATVSSTLVSQLFSDRYQDQPGLSASASASSNSATVSEAISVALKPAESIDRLGYSGQSDTSTFTQNASGSVVGVNVSLPGGATYSTTPAGAVWSYTDLHGDVIATTNSSGNPTWTGYYGPYGEEASGSQPPDGSMPGADYGYNGNQGKLTVGDIVLMGARPYQPIYGRFTQVDPVTGGCANAFTYAYGDPMNHPDLSGETVGQGDPGQAIPGLNCPAWVTGPANFLGFGGLTSAAKDLGHGDVLGAVKSVWSTITGVGAGGVAHWWGKGGAHVLITWDIVAARDLARAFGIGVATVATLVQIECGTA